MQNTCDVSMRTNYTTQLDLAIQKIRNLKGKWPRASYCTKGKWSEGTLMSMKSFRNSTEVAKKLLEPNGKIETMLRELERASAE